MLLSVNTQMATTCSVVCKANHVLTLYFVCGSLQAHSAVGSRLEAEKALTAQMNDQILDGQAAAAKLQRSIAGLEQQV